MNEHSTLQKKKPKEFNELRLKLTYQGENVASGQLTPRKVPLLLRGVRTSYFKIRVQMTIRFNYSSCWGDTVPFSSQNTRFSNDSLGFMQILRGFLKYANHQMIIT